MSDSTWFERRLAEKMKDPEFAASYQVARATIAAGLRDRLTPAQRRAMQGLTRVGAVDWDYAAWRASGKPSRLEKTLGLLADRGLIRWDEGIDEAEITPAGWAALSSRRK